jgi:flagellin-specific chaperone FliS
MFGKNKTEKMIKDFERLKIYLDAGVIFNTDYLQKLGSYLYNNLFEVDGIVKHKKWRSNKPESFCFESGGYRIFENGDIENTSGNLINSARDVKNILNAFLDRLDAASNLNKSLKKIYDIIKNEK